MRGLTGNYINDFFLLCMYFILAFISTFYSIQLNESRIVSIINAEMPAKVESFLISRNSYYKKQFDDFSNALGEKYLHFLNEISDKVYKSYTFADEAIYLVERLVRKMSKIETIKSTLKNLADSDDTEDSE